MTTRFGLASAVIAAGLSATTAFADWRFGPIPFIESSVQDSRAVHRCSFDQLPADAARINQRLAWATRCNILRVGKIFTHYLDANDEWQPLAIPKYPVFVHNTANYPAWIPDEASCDVPSDVVFYQICSPGCFEPGQKILFADGYRPIKEASEERVTKMMTLTPDSTLDAIELKEDEIQYFVRSEREAHETLLTFQTVSGGKLTVTTNHPLVNREGQMRPANTFIVGDSLVTESGALDLIVTIKSEPYIGRVYNLAPKSSDGNGNIIVAEGFLTGSHKFQTSEVQGFDGFRLRRPAVPSNLIP